MRKNKFTVSNRLKSFRYAFAGLRILLTTQHSAWCHAVATIVVIFAGLFFGLSQSEWCWLVLAMTAVWAAEAFNTSIEFVSDVVSPEYNLLIKHAKDLAAAAVLITVIGEIAIGCLTLGPYIIAYFN